MKNDIQIEHVGPEGSYQTYDAIERSIGCIDCTAMATDEHLNQHGYIQQLAVVFGAVRPLLVAVTSLPVIPPAWRTSLAVLVGILDKIAQSPLVDPDFKAGKDL